MHTEQVTSNFVFEIKQNILGILWCNKHYLLQYEYMTSGGDLPDVLAEMQILRVTVCE